MSKPLEPPASALVVPRPPRRYYLDWLRVVAVLLLLVYHTNLIFEPSSWWLIKSSEVSSLIAQLDYFVSQWRLPLLFLVSGVSTYYMLGSRSWAVYVRDRFKRLIIPLVTGALVLVPLQDYTSTMYEAIQQGRTPQYSLPLFYTDYFSGLLIQKVFPLQHLWFLQYLFMYSVLALPFFLWMRTPEVQQKSKRLEAVFSSVYTILLMALPPVLIEVVVYYILPDFSSVPERLTTYMGEHVVRYEYFIFFIYGFVLATSDALNQTLRRYRHLFLFLACSMVVVHQLLDPTARTLLSTVVSRVNTWMWVAAILGYAQVYLSRSNAFLRYTSELVAPFYIIHQPMIVLFGLFVLQSSAPLLIKLLGIIAGAFISTALLCDLVRRHDVPRFFFGMNSLAKARARKLVAPAGGDLKSATVAPTSGDQG